MSKDCTIYKTLELIGSKWSLLIILSIYKTREKRFSGIKKDLKVKDPIKIYEPQGCPQCNDKGTRGRIAVFEILAMTSELSQIIASGVSEDKLVAEAKRQNMITMFQDGILKVLDGIIGLEELIHVVSVEDVEAKIKK